jgi:hypothetical protein
MTQFMNAQQLPDPVLPAGTGTGEKSTSIVREKTEEAEL